MDNEEIADRVFGITTSRATRVDYPSYEVSDDSIYSLGYRDCCGVLLAGRGRRVMTHFDHLYDAKKYLEEAAHKVNAAIAILTGGDKINFNRIKAVLEKMGIPVVDNFCDDWDVK